MYDSQNIKYKHYGRSRSTFVIARLLLQSQEVDALGALNRQAESPVPDELHQRAEGAADTEGNGVVQRLLEAIVVEEDTGGGVDVGVGVLGLRGVSTYQAAGDYYIPFRAR